MKSQSRTSSQNKIFRTGITVVTTPSLARSYEHMPRTKVSRLLRTHQSYVSSPPHTFLTLTSVLIRVFIGLPLPLLPPTRRDRNDRAHSRPTIPPHDSTLPSPIHRPRRKIAVLSLSYPTDSISVLSGWFSLSCFPQVCVRELQRPRDGGDSGTSMGQRTRHGRGTTGRAMGKE